ncbi:MAG: nucleoside-diphosphate kinase [Aliihoeflea sp.]|uniref:nucleoside-diphosphate kinase n=1 Tax=Aliihoeflea sp. TaxID=2608088 RepID=UPI0040381418
MSTENCILTTKDFTILEVMRDRRVGTDDPLTPILERKLATATVMFREDIPADVATLSSRVTFSVDGRDPDTRVISHDQMAASVGMFLPITSVRGLALLGLREGQTFRVTTREVRSEDVLLEKVQYQPEAARRQKETLRGQSPRKPTFKLIRGALYDNARPNADFHGPDPSAA